MLENIRDFWYLYVLLFIFIIITIFVCIKAFGAASRHSKEVNALIAKAKRNKELRDAYKVLTAEIIAKAPSAELFEGVALNMEAACQKTEDTNGFYASLSDGQKKVYAFYYLASEAKEFGLSAFFKESARPLTSDAVAAAKEFLSSDIYAVINEMFACYDEENETASVIPETVDRLNEEFKNLTNDIDLFTLAGEYIKNNASEFLK
ncbi:MAG: hypothetical protein IKK49_08535 [Clostridia bacterium]|nr:hypothetical protein [Clostridia bacterium]